MNNSRRTFVRQLAIAAGGMMALTACSGVPKGGNALKKMNIAGLKNFGLQLYTLRDDMSTLR